MPTLHQAAFALLTISQCRKRRQQLGSAHFTKNFEALEFWN